MPVQVSTCGECKWWRSLNFPNETPEGKDGHCYFLPMKVSKSRNEWCGQFRRNKPKPSGGNDAG